MCGGVIREDLHLASTTGMVDIICDGLTYDDLNPGVCENVALGLMIYCVII